MAFDNLREKFFLITGVSGFIGKHLTDRLLGEGAQVYGIDVVDPNRDDIDFLGDLMNDPARLKEATKDLRIDGIFHMAVVPLGATNENPRGALRTNIEGTFNIVELAKDKGCKVVFSSASSVYGETEETVDESMSFNPANFYGASKGASELMCRAATNQWQVPTISLRYMNVYGPGQAGGLIPAVIRKVMAGEAPQLTGDGSAMFDFVYVGDVVNANILAMTSGISGRDYNVGSGTQVKVLDIARRILELAGLKLEPTFKEAPPGSVNRRVGSSKRAVRDLGYQPQIALTEGLERTWQSFIQTAAGAAR